MRPVALKEREILLAMKLEEHKAKGLPFDGEFYIWDYRYYDRKYVEKLLSVRCFIASRPPRHHCN